MGSEPRSRWHFQGYYILNVGMSEAWQCKVKYTIWVLNGLCEGMLKWSSPKLYLPWYEGVGQLLSINLAMCMCEVVTNAI